MSRFVIGQEVESLAAGWTAIVGAIDEDDGTFMDRNTGAWHDEDDFDALAASEPHVSHCPHELDAGTIRYLGRHGAAA